MTDTIPVDRRRRPPIGGVVLGVVALVLLIGLRRGAGPWRVLLHPIRAHADPRPSSSRWRRMRSPGRPASGTACRSKRTSGRRAGARQFRRDRPSRESLRRQRGSRRCRLHVVVRRPRPRLGGARGRLVRSDGGWTVGSGSDRERDAAASIRRSDRPFDCRWRRSRTGTGRPRGFGRSRAEPGPARWSACSSRHEVTSDLVAFVSGGQAEPPPADLRADRSGAVARFGDRVSGASCCRGAGRPHDDEARARSGAPRSAAVHRRTGSLTARPTLRTGGV